MSGGRRGLNLTRRARNVTEQELELWRNVNKDTALSSVEAPKLPTIRVTGKAPLAPTPRTNAAGALPRFTSTPAPTATGLAAKALTQFSLAGSPVDPLLRDKTPGLDRNTARALRRGERTPDARVDLHGMTADIAHQALNAFILSARMRGHRCVLVITGKGRKYGVPSESGFSMERSEGVLRRDVPRWLRQAPLRDVITGVYQAHQRHGGDGAFYVYLQKNR